LQLLLLLLLLLLQLANVDNEGVKTGFKKIPDIVKNYPPQDRLDESEVLCAEKKIFKIREENCGKINCFT
jgi:hypothetical protein